MQGGITNEEILLAGSRASQEESERAVGCGEREKVCSTPRGTLRACLPIPYWFHGVTCRFPHALRLSGLSASRARIGEIDDCGLHQRPGSVRGVLGRTEPDLERSKARRRARIPPGIIFTPARRPFRRKEAFRHTASLPAFAA